MPGAADENLDEVVCMAGSVEEKDEVVIKFGMGSTDNNIERTSIVQVPGGVEKDSGGVVPGGGIPMSTSGPQPGEARLACPCMEAFQSAVDKPLVLGGSTSAVVVAVDEEMRGRVDQAVVMDAQAQGEEEKDCAGGLVVVASPCLRVRCSLSRLAWPVPAWKRFSGLSRKPWFVELALLHVCMI